MRSTIGTRAGSLISPRIGTRSPNSPEPSRSSPGCSSPARTHGPGTLGVQRTEETVALPTTPTTPPLEDVVYPESDGQPMGETGFHVRAMLWLLQALMD